MAPWAISRPSIWGATSWHTDFKLCVLEGENSKALMKSIGIGGDCWLRNDFARAVLEVTAKKATWASESGHSRLAI